ncbi:hypothetical protein DAEQUDRAFT_747827 [Daedalea quercina L-15889]|uniref:F-box domain-containing protein n=1 Tax=Daedalea quercina L-15889 TaxID=1314783 RepID=A0A165KRD8_9APHY|nr:hypothetical protein DAEQUDRAFT_747827 [Daedalea quercina L-15889]
MVSADNLNLDCLEHIFAYLYGNDLVSVSLVSRSFLAGVVPRLYRSLIFKLNQAKRYPAILSPFASVLRHPSLATHVRHIDIRTVPSNRSIIHPEFMRDCARTVDICDNLVSFTCTPSVLPSFLLNLQSKHSLQHLRASANLTHDQAEHLAKIKGLKSITLDAGSLYAVDILPKWVTGLKTTLTSLALYSVHELNESILESVLINLPLLTGLHVVNCSKVDHNTVLRLTSYTPDLRSLSFTSWDSPRAMAASSIISGITAPLRRLRHLTIDSHCSLSPTAMPGLWTSLIQQTRMWSSPLRSITLKLTDKLLIADSFIHQLLDSHTLLNCSLSLDSIRNICRRCPELERFAVSIPVKDIYSFAEALSKSTSLHTLSDVTDAHSSHGARVTISKPDIRTIMEIVSNLRRVITDERVWTAEKRKHGGLRLELKRKTSPPAHWFMPPSKSQQY